ncbi:PD-(D/E)XK nuclease-like domain-containing protein [Methylosinus sporium]|uniref:Uncharacterized protein n=1 Tax=Methylosinus sporium TaxID=428 RepID=A0A2U1SSX7_METSR|nr:PD-(D/E)XK nuclease-like domain-containing protein [Methylosinus sporium]PWB94702.1 hypothetical protein C5689_06455 [Methylosinus sporium]
MNIEILPAPKGKITKPGIYDLSMAAYHRADICDGVSISSTGLRVAISKSIRHWWDKYLNPDREEEDDASDDTKYSILGRAGHHLLLGEAAFVEHFVLRPNEAPDATGKIGPWNGNKTFCRKWEAEQVLAGKGILTETMLKQVKGIAKSFAANPHVRGGILNGLVEKSFFWKDKETGVWLKARPDAVPLADETSVDVKIVQDASRRGVQRSLNDSNLHIQAALVGMGLEEVLGWKRNDGLRYLMFGESVRPHCCVIQPISEYAIDYARLEIRATLRKIAEALNNARVLEKENPKLDRFPMEAFEGYETRDFQTVSLPKYRSDEYEKMIEGGIIPRSE